MAQPASALTVTQSLGLSGIAFVHQELNLFEYLDVGANVLIGTGAAATLARCELIDRKATCTLVDPVAQRLDVDFHVGTPWSPTSPSPSASCSKSPKPCRSTRASSSWTSPLRVHLRETDQLLRIIADLKANDVSVILSRTGE